MSHNDDNYDYNLEYFSVNKQEKISRISRMKNSILFTSNLYNTEHRRYFRMLLVSGFKITYMSDIPVTLLK